MPEEADASVIGDLGNITKEFENVENFVESDNTKSDRFKNYLKSFYDYLKVNEEEISSDLSKNSQKPVIKRVSSVPELIVDKNIVDSEQIYQQLQLYNNELDSSSSINSLTKFFSKSLVSIDSISFNIDVKKSGNSLNSDNVANGTTTDNFDDSNDGEDEDDELEDDDFESDDDINDESEGELSDDSVDNMLKKSKIKLDINKKEADLKTKKAPKKAEETYGIPDGSDSEISDFEVDGNVENGDEEDKEQDEEDELDDEFRNLDGEGEEEDDLDSDEVDEELVDLYTDLGDEKEIMGIGKATKSFDQIDFDREDFGMNDNEDELPEGDENFDNELEDDEQAFIEKELKESSKLKKKSNDLFDQGDNEEAKAENDLTGKSSYEIRQMKLKEQIDDIHKEMLGDVTEKQWQLKGEVTAKTRPKESLLEEYLEFDHTTRQAPIVSTATTESLEALIKRRIKDKAFDDVERKVKPVEMLYEYKKQVVLDQEKSKVGLGDVYEKEFLKQQEIAEGLVSGESKEVVNPQHTEIKKLMEKLFIKLDALSNFHYTPKAPMPEMKVVSNMPTISMEEVAPVMVNDTNTLAPEEIRKNIDKLPKSKSEEDKSDKKKNMRAKKIKGKKIKEAKEKRLAINQALHPENEKLAKEAAMEKLKKQSKNMSKNIKILKTDKKTKVNSAYKSSSAFFEQLQETNQPGFKAAAAKKRLGDSKDKLTSKKLKL